MALQDTNRVALYHSVEGTWGETPATPTMTELRYTGESLTRHKDTVQSDLLRSDKMRDDVFEVLDHADGGINFELAYNLAPNLLQGAVTGTIGAAISLTPSFTVDAGAKTFTDGTSSFIVAGLVVGQWVNIAGAALNPANRGLFQITTIAATVLTFANATGLVTDAVSHASTLKGQVLRNGVVSKSFLIEAQFSQLSKFKYFTGMRVNTTKFSIASKAIVKADMTFMGKTGFFASATQSGSLTPAAIAKAMTASVNVGTLGVSGTPLASRLKTIDIDLNQNLRQQDAVGTKSLIGVGEGYFEVSGTMDAYFEDLVLLNDIVNHSYISLTVPMTDANGNSIIFTIPNLVLTDGTPLTPGANQDVMVKIDWKAIRDPVTNCSFQIDTIPA